MRDVMDALALPSRGAKSDIPLKSATPLLAFSHSRWQLLSLQTKAVISSAFQIAQSQKSRVSPSGHFRIHYDTSGTDTPALLNAGQTADLPGTYEAYVDSVAAIFDYCWTFQIDSLGYSPPASDGGWGGGPEYDIFIQNLDYSTFGFTSFDDSTFIGNTTGAPRYWACTTIDNDFLEYRTQGMDALRATAAHEFQHAIHLGGYGLLDTRDEYFFELSAGWMEGVNFPAVHDYYFDVAEFFTSFRNGTGSYPFYFFDPLFVGSERGIWGQYVARRFGRDMMRTIWEYMRSERTIAAINDAFAAQGTDFATEYALFSEWNYYTADRADPVHYYPEGIHYPRFVPNATARYVGGTASIGDQAHVFSTSFYSFLIGGDTLTAVLSNVDLRAAEQDDAASQSLQIVVGASVTPFPSQLLSDGLSAGIGVANSSVWRESYLLASTHQTVTTALAGASPNPLVLATAPQLALPVREQAGTPAQVSFVSSALHVSYATPATVNSYSGRNSILVSSGELEAHLSTGVYFVFARVAGTEYQWKVVVIR
ncbi:MAG TPA: MXAN_6640 family putative metalloprotease [Bacteroidota bacterium]|nr:MXAN_6640 family putative metalloprotease [Bacteroidota bacterium]